MQANKRSRAHHVRIPKEVLRPPAGVDEVLAVVVGVRAGRPRDGGLVPAAASATAARALRTHARSYAPQALKITLGGSSSPQDLDLQPASDRKSNTQICFQQVLRTR